MQKATEVLPPLSHFIHRFNIHEMCEREMTENLSLHNTTVKIGDEMGPECRYGDGNDDDDGGGVYQKDYWSIMEIPHSFPHFPAVLSFCHRRSTVDTASFTSSCCYLCTQQCRMNEQRRRLHREFFHKQHPSQECGVYRNFIIIWELQNSFIFTRATLKWVNEENCTLKKFTDIFPSVSSLDKDSPSILWDDDGEEFVIDCFEYKEVVSSSETPRQQQQPRAKASRNIFKSSSLWSSVISWWVISTFYRSII